MDILLEAATRVFRREGWRATTNRIAAEAGVSIGSLYEYFPDKASLLLALAERHVEVAEREIGHALEREHPLPELLEALQRAILASQRFPSEALGLVAAEPRGALSVRAAALRTSALGALARAMTRLGRAPEVAELRARAAFGAIGELSVKAWLESPNGSEPLLSELLLMAARHCAGG